MSVDEEQGHRIHNKLGELLGPEDAGGLMDMLPRHASSELATRDDVLATATLLRGEMSELRGEMSELRTELKGDMAELRGEMSELRLELKGDVAELRGEFVVMKAEILSEFTSKTHQMLVATLMAVASTAAIVLAAAAFMGPA